jgi:hypothetical protein
VEYGKIENDANLSTCTTMDAILSRKKETFFAVRSRAIEISLLFGDHLNPFSIPIFWGSSTEERSTNYYQCAAGPKFLVRSFVPVVRSFVQCCITPYEASLESLRTDYYIFENVVTIFKTTPSGSIQLREAVCMPTVNCSELLHHAEKVLAVGLSFDASLGPQRRAR